MAKYNIVAKNVSIPTSEGTKNYYNMVLVDEETGQIKSAINTTSQAEAEKYIAETRIKHSDNVTINGKHPGGMLDPNAGPFSDGTFNKQKNYDTASRDEDLDLNLDPQGMPGSQNYSNYESNSTFSDYDSSLPPISPSGGESGMSPSMFNLSIFEKKARDLDGASEKKKQQFESLTEEQRGAKNVSGVFGSKRVQATTKRENTPSELIVARGPDNNAFIVIGNDRVSKPHTGYGGKGHTQSDSIDLVAGLGGWNPREVEKIDAQGGNKVESEIKTNPNFFIDSARIYISQKIDVDKNFGIGEFGLSEENNKDDKDDKEIGKYGAKSAVVAKADNIRLIGRESIRIVTGTDRFNSQGGEVL